MKMRWLIATVAVFALVGLLRGDTPARLTYPAVRTVDVVEDYHGTKVPDPYRWLEDPDTPESRAWIEAQNKLTFGYLEKLPQRARMKQRLTELRNHEHYNVPPVAEGGRLFFLKNDALQAPQAGP